MKEEERKESDSFRYLREEKHLLYCLLKNSVQDEFLYNVLVRMEELDDLIELKK